jgi:hypothetical protein
MVFQTLCKASDALCKDLANGTKLKRAELTHVLDRPVALGLAKKVKTRGETFYSEIDKEKNQ